MPDGSSSAAPVISPGPSSRTLDTRRSRRVFFRGRYGRGVSRRSARIASPARSSSAAVSEGDGSEDDEGVIEFSIGVDAGTGWATSLFVDFACHQVVLSSCVYLLSGDAPVARATRAQRRCRDQSACAGRAGGGVLEPHLCAR